MLSEYTQKVIHVFELHEDPQNSGPMAKYMKGKFEYYGIKAPLRKEITKSLLIKTELPIPGDVPQIVVELWDQPQRELQYFALELLQKYMRNTPSDWIDFYEDLITKKSWWDTVDGLAANQVGGYFLKYPEQLAAYTGKWMDSGNIWLQRTCLIFQLKYRENTDFDLLKSFILSLSDSREFFIRKAIGWCLRQYAKSNPDAVIEFVEGHDLSNLSRREALKGIA